MESGVIVVFDHLPMVTKAIAESAWIAVTSAARDTEAEAKLQITAQVYSREIPASMTGKRRRTGAARAGIYSKAPERDTYPKAAADAKNKRPEVVLFDPPPVKTTGPVIEGVVGCAVEYGANIECGATRTNVSVPPRPFMLPAFEKIKPEFEKIAVEQLNGRIR